MRRRDGFISFSRNFVTLTIGQQRQWFTVGSSGRLFRGRRGRRLSALACAMSLRRQIMSRYNQRRRMSRVARLNMVDLWCYCQSSSAKIQIGRVWKMLAVMPEWHPGNQGSPVSVTGVPTTRCWPIPVPAWGDRCRRRSTARSKQVMVKPSRNNKTSGSGNMVTCCNQLLGNDDADQAIIFDRTLVTLMELSSLVVYAYCLATSELTVVPREIIGWTRRRCSAPPVAASRLGLMRARHARVKSSSSGDG